MSYYRKVNTVKRVGALLLDGKVLKLIGVIKWMLEGFRGWKGVGKETMRLFYFLPTINLQESIRALLILACWDTRIDL